MDYFDTGLAELFPEGAYRFHLTLRRGEPQQFFARREPTGNVLAERRRWLQAEPERYAALLPEGEPLVAEFAAMVAEWGVAGMAGRRIEDAGGLANVIALGGALEPDVLLLSPDDAGSLRLRGGALCFPTGWALEEKIGHPLDEIHGVVPGLNPALGAQIQQFLARLKPGVAFLRDNWGIAASDELNLHPARRVPPPMSPVALDRLWLRVEHQALLALPQSRGIVFGIRIALHRLDALAGTTVATGLRRSLETMPSQLAAYKRLETIRDELVALL